MSARALPRPLVAAGTGPGFQTGVGSCYPVPGPALGAQRYPTQQVVGDGHEQWHAQHFVRALDRLDHRQAPQGPLYPLLALLCRPLPRRLLPPAYPGVGAFPLPGQACHLLVRLCQAALQRFLAAKRACPRPRRVGAAGWGSCGSPISNKVSLAIVPLPGSLAYSPASAGRRQGVCRFVHSF